MPPSLRSSWPAATAPRPAPPVAPWWLFALAAALAEQACTPPPPAAPGEPPASCTPLASAAPLAAASAASSPPPATEPPPPPATPVVAAALSPNHLSWSLALGDLAEARVFADSKGGAWALGALPRKGYALLHVDAQGHRRTTKLPASAPPAACTDASGALWLIEHEAKAGALGEPLATRLRRHQPGGRHDLDKPLAEGKISIRAMTAGQGGVWIGGTILGRAKLGDTELVEAPAGGRVEFVAALSPEGKPRWIKALSSLVPGTLRALATDATGRPVLLAKWHEGPASKGQAGAPRDAALVALSADGSPRWAAPIRAPDTQLSQLSLTLLGLGRSARGDSLLLSSSGQSRLEIGGRAFGAAQPFLANLDENGALQWARETTASDAFAFDKKGQLWLASVITEAGSLDLEISAFNPDGEATTRTRTPLPPTCVQASQSASIAADSRGLVASIECRKFQEGDYQGPTGPRTTQLLRLTIP